MYESHGRTMSPEIGQQEGIHHHSKTNPHHYKTISISIFARSSQVSDTKPSPSQSLHTIFTSNTNADVTGPLKTTSQGPTNPSSQDHTIPNYTAGHIELLHTEDHLLHTGLAQMTKLKPFHQGFYADYSYHLHQIAQRTRPATMLHHSVFVPISHQLKPQRTLPDHKDDILNRTNHSIFTGTIPFHIGHPRTNPYHTITSSSLDVAAATLHYHEVRYFPFTLENPNNCRYGKPNHQKHPEAPMELHHMITSSGNIYHADHPESRHFVPSSKPHHPPPQATHKASTISPKV